jgi:hypothetical protein
MSEATPGIPRPAYYLVKVYSGGQVMQTYEAATFSTSKGEVWITLPCGRRHIVGRSCSVRLSNSGPPAESTLEVIYEADLYSGGKLVETVKVNSYSGYEGNVYLTDVFGERVVFAGTYVIRRIGAHLNVQCDRSRHKVTAYSGGAVIGTWYALHVTTAQNMLYLQGANFYDVIVGGNFVAEQYR